MYRSTYDYNESAVDLKINFGMYQFASSLWLREN